MIDAAVGAAGTVTVTGPACAAHLRRGAALGRDSCARPSIPGSLRSAPRLALAAGARRLRCLHAPDADRRGAAAHHDPEPQDAAGLSAGLAADAAADLAERRPEFAVAGRQPRLLQGSAREPGRRHPDHRHQLRRQGAVQQRDPDAAHHRRADGISNLFGLEQQIPKILPHAANPASLVNINGTTNNDGKAAITREEQVTLEVAALVMQVLPNGNLVVQGHQEMRVNNEVRDLQITGVLRPQDISAINTDDARQARRGAGFLWRPRRAHRRSAAALRRAAPGHRRAVLRPAAIPRGGCAPCARDAPAPRGSSVAMGRASSRRRPIGSSVSSQ